MAETKLSGEQFLAAVAKGDAPSVKTALDAGMAADTADAYGNSALMIGCARGRTEVCRLLLEAGADADHKNKWGKGPLDWLRWQPDADGIRRMLAAS